MQKRIDYYDNAKGILILFVILGHVLIFANQSYSNLLYICAQNFIYAFHIPAFFLISGMLFNTDKWKTGSWQKFLLKRVKSLVIPYVFFELIAVVYKACILRSITVVQGLCNLATLNCNIGADWFLPAMFLAQLFFFVYVKHPDKIIASVIAVACFFCTWYIPADHWFAVLCRGLLGFGFMYLGYMTKNILDYSPRKRMSNSAFIGVSFLITGFCAILGLKFWYNDFFDCVVENPLLYAVGGICGLYFVLGIAKLIHWKWLRWFGENSLVVMGTHQLVLYTVPSSSSIFWVIGVFVLIVAIEVPLIYLTNKFCPFLIGKGK